MCQDYRTTRLLSPFTNLYIRETFKKQSHSNIHPVVQANKPTPQEITIMSEHAEEKIDQNNHKDESNKVIPPF